MHEPIETVHCRSADQLVDAVSPRGRYFRNTSPVSGWLFRGHGFDRYKLIPSSLRENNSEFLFSLAQSEMHLPQNKRDTNVGQALAEVRVLSKLYSELDKHGLPIPDDSPHSRAVLEAKVITLQGDFNTFQDKKLSWWSSEADRPLVPLMALAQHIGLPTRLLDWTRSGLIAAYFAARSNIGKRGRDLAVVWAIDSTARRYVTPMGLSMKERLLALTAPRSSNPNLHAQDGLFTLVMPHQPTTLAAIDRRPLDGIINSIDRSYLKLTDAPLMYRFTFRRALAPKILWLLAKEGITAAQLFPGHRGIATAITEQSFWSHRVAP